MIYVQVIDELFPAGQSQPFEEAWLTGAAQETLRQAGEDAEVDLTITLGDDELLKSLNQRFLGIEQPTDVLSFYAGDLDPDSGQLYLGDVVISFHRAVEQAQAGGHPVADELQLLVVHGVLHLLGHDHANEEEKKTMWELQSSILRSLGSAACPPFV